MTEKIEEQASLFEKGEGWDEEWQGMPEFIQEDLSPFASVKINFKTREDMEDFFKIIGQDMVISSRSIWHPKSKYAELKKLLYRGSDES